MSGNYTPTVWTVREKLKHPGKLYAADEMRAVMDALDTLRAAWNAHMEACPQHASLPTFMKPTPEDIDRWLNAPSDTAAGRDGGQ